MTAGRIFGPLAALLLCMLAAACVSIQDSGPSASTATVGPQGQPGAGGGELWLIPSPESDRLMRATLFRPAGPGPFPLAVVNHGSEQDAARRVAMPLPAFPAITAWLVARNYAVLVPQRPGHGATGGRYLEDQGSCTGADYIGAGNGAADSIAAAVAYMTGQPFVRPAGVVVVGNSAGGWGALALAARNPPSVAAVVTFAAGRGGRDRDRAGQNCAPDRLVAAAATFGATARVPTLLLYAENDTYFPPTLSRRVAEAFIAAGGHGTYRLLPPVGSEGHALMEAGESSWAGDVERFLAGIR